VKVIAQHQQEEERENNMRMSLSRLLIASSVALSTAVFSLAAQAQTAPPDNWGQEVKECNLSNCYDGGGPRGTYVPGEAQDQQTPGYANEIHSLVEAFGTDGPGKVETPVPFVD
jgi:hypothetical protein